MDDASVCSGGDEPTSASFGMSIEGVEVTAG